jgi:hypothetical protein
MSVNRQTERARARRGRRPIRASSGLCLLCVAGLGLAGPVGATDTTRYTAYSFTEKAAPGLAVAGPLKGFRVVSRGRVVVPGSWKRLSSPAGELDFESTDSPGCAYSIGFSIVSRIVPIQTTAAYLAGVLPTPGSRRLLDSGQRGDSAFRVVRPASTNAIVHVRGLWATILTRRTDIVPAAGQIAWSLISVRARSRAGEECHSGTYRDVLGPQIGDALATARSSLDFVGHQS